MQIDKLARRLAGPISEAWSNLGAGEEQCQLALEHLNFSALHGGDINLVFRVSAQGFSSLPDLCVKYLDDPPEGAFMLEALGLEALNRAWPEHSPQVLAYSEGCLVLEYLPPDRSQTRSAEDWQGLAQGLYQIHHQQGRSQQLGYCLESRLEIDPENKPIFGLDEISWPEFFARYRLIPVLSRLDLRPELRKAAAQLCSKLRSFLPQLSYASLLHGDLWGGNLHWSGGSPYLIDPAVYQGHWEVDFAMMRLFGGFAAECYDEYFSLQAPDPGFAERIEIYQLYPLLRHLELFGNSYLPSVERIIRRYA